MGAARRGAARRSSRAARPCPRAVPTGQQRDDDPLEQTVLADDDLLHLEQKPFERGRRFADVRHLRRVARMAVSAYILIQTEVGKAAEVATNVGAIDGVKTSEDVT